MSQDILVALDPFAKDPVSLKKAMTTTKALADALDASVDPVAVVSPDQLQWPSRFDGTWAEQFSKAALTGLKKVAVSAGLRANKIEIVEQPVHSLRASVASLVEKAEARDPLAIAVFTHHRKSSGLRIFGTFATALLSKSSYPLVFINAKAKEIRSFKRILFATDFSAESRKAFDTVLEMAREMRAEVVLFHALTPISAEVYASVGLMGGFANYDVYVRDEERQSAEDAKLWVKAAKDAGVEARFVLHHADFRPSSAIVESASRLKADLIAVCSKTTGVSVVILGSVTRDLIETSKKPVLVIPSSAEAADATTSKATRDRRGARAPSAPAPSR